MSVLKNSFIVASVAVLAITVGCAVMPYAREVKKKPSDGGTIALRTTHSEEDRAKAQSMMTANCAGKDVKVLEEGEVTVGTRTQSNANRSYGETTNNAFSIGSLNFGSTTPSENTNVSSETSAVKEWQINYECIAKTDAANGELVAKRPKAKKAK